MRHPTTPRRQLRPVGAGGRDRIRWTAMAAVLAALVGAGGGLTASASIDSGSRAVFVPIAPCRLVDTRTAPDTVGPRTSPLGPGETFTVSGRGSVGKCTIPNDAVGLAMNVAIVNPTAGSYLTVFPADASPRPTAANMNWVAGQAPTSNAVQAALSADGHVSFYNLAGTVDLAVDVNGYYADHTHDDRYYTKDQTYTKAETYSAAQVRLRVADGPEVLAVSPNFPPPTLPGVQQSVGANFTTTRASKLAIAMNAGLAITCQTTFIADAWLTIDGVVIPSSIVGVAVAETGAAFGEISVTGVTSAAIAAGHHDVVVNEACGVGNWLGGTTAGVASGTVTYVADSDPTAP